MFDWALSWLVGIVMLFLTASGVFGVIGLGWYLYYWVNLLEDINRDKVSRLADVRDRDKKMLDLELAQHTKLLADSNMINPDMVSTRLSKIK